MAQRTGHTSTRVNALSTAASLDGSSGDPSFDAGRNRAIARCSRCRRQTKTSRFRSKLMASPVNHTRDHRYRGVRKRPRTGWDVLSHGVVSVPQPLTDEMEVTSFRHTLSGRSASPENVEPRKHFAVSWQPRSQAAKDEMRIKAFKNSGRTDRRRAKNTTTRQKLLAGWAHESQTPEFQNLREL